MEPEFAGLGFPQFGASNVEGDVTPQETTAPAEDSGWGFSWIGNFFRATFWGSDPAPKTQTNAPAPSGGEVKPKGKGKKKIKAAAATVAPAPAAAPATGAPAAAV